MATTLAHEIHNSLDTVGNLLFLINHNPDVPNTVRQHVSMASEELTRVSQITRHMLFFQREAKSPVPIKIGEIPDNVIALLRAEDRVGWHPSAKTSGIRGRTPAAAPSRIRTPTACEGPPSAA